MAMFGGMPGYGGGMFPTTPPPFGSPIPQIPDYMSGINASLARNEQLGEEKKSKKFDFGKFLGMWAGHLGDSLTGNNAYASTRQRQAEAEAEERSRRERAEAEKAWWYEQQKYKADNEKPDYEGNIDHYRQSIELGYIKPETTYPQFLQMVNPQAPPAPWVQPYNTKPVGGGPGPSAQAIEYLKANPALAPQFDQKYGPGASQRYLGGQSGVSSTGGFL